MFDSLNTISKLISFTATVFLLTKFRVLTNRSVIIKTQQHNVRQKFIKFNETNQMSYNNNQNSSPKNSDIITCQVLKKIYCIRSFKSC